MNAMTIAHMAGILTSPWSSSAGDSPQPALLNTSRIKKRLTSA